MFYTQVNLGFSQENKMRFSIQAENIPAEKMLEDYLTMVMFKQARVLMHTFKDKKERKTFKMRKSPIQYHTFSFILQ